MRKLFVFWINKNPIDDMWQAKMHIPSSARELLATMNPRPSGLILRGLSVLDGKDFWTLTSEEWRHEAAHNSGIYIAFLIRNPSVCPEGFDQLFNRLENEYQALLRKKDWVKANLAGQARPAVVGKLINGLHSELASLEVAFVEWAVENHAGVIAAIRSVVDTPDGGCNGNAEQEWLRARAP